MNQTLTTQGKAIVLILALFFLYGLSCMMQGRGVVDVNESPFTKLLNAIEFVESRCNADAIGDNGNAVGSFQIWKIYVDDVNRILALNGSTRKYFYQARQVRSSSRDMVTIYLKHYGGTKRLGREATFQEMAAMHCAGPDGYMQMDEPNVKKYIKKITDRLDKTR